MRNRSVIRSRKHPAPVHKYTFEIRPRDADESPVKLPAHVSVRSTNADNALIAAAAMVPLGWLIIPVGHDVTL
jgi:hypothetical protein